jgi:hypothetical protein
MISNNTRIQLVKDTIDKQDINKLIKWLKTEPQLTKGPLVVEFEKNIILIKFLCLFVWVRGPC